MKFLVFNNKNGLGTADKLIVNWDSVKYIKPIDGDTFYIELNNGAYLEFDLSGANTSPKAIEAINRVVKADPNSRVLEVKPRSLTEFNFSSITYNENPTGPGYKTFAVLLTQTGTNDPTSTVLKNDFPASTNFNFIRVNTGGYRLTANGSPFTTNKTVVSAFNNGLGNGGAAPPQSVIWTRTSDGLIDFLVGADGVITDGFFEVRVYD